jgi:hypothetical protein
MMNLYVFFLVMEVSLSGTLGRWPDGDGAWKITNINAKKRVQKLYLNMFWYSCMMFFTSAERLWCVTNFFVYGVTHL